MSIKGATSINIKPCRVGESMDHNFRKKELNYVRPELSHLNESWLAPGGEDLVKHSAMLHDIYRARFGRRMQAKAAPIREGVITLNDSVTMDELKDFAAEMEKNFPLKVLQLHIHDSDEGHFDEHGQYVKNRHAHIVLDYFDMATGKTFRPTRQQMAKMQTILAQTIHMQRGESSDVKHLSALQYKNQEQAKQLLRLEQLLREKQQLIEEKEQLLQEKQRLLHDADKHLEEKARQIKAIGARLMALAKTEKEFNQLREIMTENGLKMPEPTFKQKPTPLEPKFKRKI